MKLVAWWVGSILLLIFGLIAEVSVIVVMNRVPSEADLTYVEGEPQNVERPGGGKVDYVIRFTINGYRVEYPKDHHATYGKVDYALTTQKHISVGIASLTGGTPQQGDIATLYTMTAGEEVVLAYDDAIREERVKVRAGLLSGALLTLLGIVSTFFCYRYTRNRRAQGGVTPSEDS